MNCNQNNQSTRKKNSSFLTTLLRSKRGILLSLRLNSGLERLIRFLEACVGVLLALSMLDLKRARRIFLYPRGFFSLPKLQKVYSGLTMKKMELQLSLASINPPWKKTSELFSQTPPRQR